MEISITKDTLALLDIVQKETKRDKDEIIFNALVEYLENIQDYKSALEAEKRMLGKTSFITLDELMKKANIDASEI